MAVYRTSPLWSGFLALPALNHVTCKYGGPKWPHIWNSLPHIAYSLCNFYGAAMTINGSLFVSIPIVKRFSVENFLSPAKTGPENGVFRENGGLNVKFYFQNPQKAHPCAEPRLLMYFAGRSVWGPRLWLRGRTPQKIIAEPRGVIFHPHGEKNPGPIWTKFCTEGDIRDVITVANFGIDRFKPGVLPWRGVKF